MKKIEALKTLLPWYANGTSDGEETRQVEAWLSVDAQARLELEAWRKVIAAVESQPLQRPSAQARRTLLAGIRRQSRTQTVLARRPWSPAGMVGAATLAIIVLVALWAVIKPGVVLQWTVSDSPLSVQDRLSTYRVYRAPQGSADFKLLHEAPAQMDQREYTYIDIFMLPGQAYSYQVEGLSAAGQVAISQTVIGSAQAALPGQLAILFTSLLVGASTGMLLQAWLGGRAWLRRGILA